MSCTGAQYRFRENDYATEEGVNSVVTVVVEQLLPGLIDIHLLLTPLTYDQYNQRANQPGSDLPPLDRYHDSRPGPAECKTPS